MAQGLKWAREPGEAMSFANWVGMMLGAQCNRECKVGTGTPFILAVKPETIECKRTASDRGKGLAKCREIRVLFCRVRIDSSPEKCIDRLRRQLAYAGVIEIGEGQIEPLKAHSKPKLSLSMRLHKVRA